ncbi:MAG: DUF4129 domain-containing protein [Firmicutes bacterium]|nr:DUF4129 domain-containing protein [Bacillota bacterium]
MKFPVWNYFRASFLVFIQGILVTILLYPWLQLAESSWDFLLFAQTFWVFCTTLTSIWVAKKVAGRGKKGLPILLLGLVVPLGLAFLWSLPLVLCLPLTIALLYLGSRFTYYPRRRRFALDWAWGSLFLVVTAIFESTLGYELGLFPMLLFFALGMLALIFWNATALEGEGLAPDYGGLGRTVTLFVLVVGGLALLLGALLSPDFLQNILGVLGKIYGVFIDGVVFLIVRPFAWLMSPLFRWADQVEKQEVPMEFSRMERFPMERPEIEGGLNPATVQTLGWGGWLFFILVLLLVVWLVLRKLLNRPRESSGGLVRESRESVYSRGEVLEDLKGALQTLVRPLTRLRQPKWYRGADPLLVIRTYYARFAVRASKEVPFEEGTTPLEYACKLPQQQDEVNQEALQTLTSYYNEARYGERGDEQAVKGTEQAFRQL